MNLSTYINQIVLLLILAVAGWLGVQVRNLYRRYVTSEIKQAVCRTAVRFVEQVYKDLHGREKLEQAMRRASEMLAEYGIDISKNELVSLLEAAVNEFNNAFHKSYLQTEDPTFAYYGKHSATLKPQTEDPEQDEDPAATEENEDLLVYKIHN